MRRRDGEDELPRWQRTVPVLVVLVAAGLTGVTWAEATVTDSPAGRAHDQERDEPSGELLYLRDCASCHAPEGTGTTRGPDLGSVGPAGTFYVLSTGRMPIATPDATIERSRPRYAATEIDRIVDHVRDLVGGPEIPDVDVARADVARGGETYRLECAACHSATGIGGALAFEGHAPNVLHATPDEAVAAIVSGPGQMPTFRGRFTDQDVADVAAYVRFLDDPPRTGVTVPGGRVGEGLVAWVAGVGLLVVAARWIGTRR